MERNRIYFASDAHLGLDVKDAPGREERFVRFLRGIPAPQTRALYLLGDVWDFWYEYRDVVPKGYVRVFAALTDLMDAGVEVYFCPGNHDIWCYSYFEELGIRIISQPHVFETAGKVFCVGHGDGLGYGHCSYKAMKAVFENKVAQALFSTLHPWIAFSLGNAWSKGKRLSRHTKYQFRGPEEPLYRYAEDFSQRVHVDFFIFGHYHSPYEAVLQSGASLRLLGDWMDGDDYLYFDGTTVLSGQLPNTEK